MKMLDTKKQIPLNTSIRDAVWSNLEGCTWYKIYRDVLYMPIANTVKSLGTESIASFILDSVKESI